MSSEDISIAMTKLEIILKQQLELRPDIKSKILTFPEFLEYMDWVKKANDIKLNESEMRNIISLECTEKEKIVCSAPFEKTSWNMLLGNSFLDQPEANFINPDYNISVRRALRYFPAYWCGGSYFEVYYLYSGESTIHFKNKSVKLEQGSVIIVAPYSPHAFRCYSDDCFLLVFLIRASTIEHVFWDLISLDNFMGSFFRMALSGEENMEYLRFDTGNDKDIMSLAYGMLKENLNANSYCSQILNSMMTEFFFLVLRRYESTAQLPKSKDFFWKREYSAILNYIMKNYAAASLKDVSRLFHYSPRQIERIISKYAGMSFTDLILKLRMEKSAKLLKEGALSINQISEAAGYSTLSTFYRAFNKYFGTSPQKFRLKTNNTDIES